jgi:hypothetical protein
MDLTRRFVFRGHASALAGQIFRPQTIIVDLDGASALGVSGGRSQSRLAGRSFGDIIRFSSATTLAEGLFDDEALARDVTNQKGKQEELNSTTKATAEIRDLLVGQKPLFTAKRIRGTLVSRKPDQSGEPSIGPATDTTIQGVDIGGHVLDIKLNTGLFRKHDTRSKILASADDPKFVTSFGVHLVPNATIEGQTLPRPGLVTRYGVIYTTIVAEIRWAGRPFPGAKIDGHSVIVPNFGRIFFGELLIASSERRMTMVRFELGSPVGGYADGVDVGSNGSFYP